MSTNEARILESIEAYVAAWNERDRVKRMRLVERACAPDVLFRTGGRRLQGHAELIALIAAFQEREPNARAVFASAIDVQGHLFRYAGRVEGTASGGEALDTGECDDDGRICVLLTYVGIGLPT